MIRTDLIVISEYCRHCDIEPSFIELLYESGLIDIYREAGESYLFVSQLPRLESYSRMYYDLSINPEGIDAIRHLLERVERLQQELQELREQLLLYERQRNILRDSKS